MAAHPPSASLASRTTPLWAVLLFTFLNSIGSGIVYSGIFFIAESVYRFDPTKNFLLGLLYGVTYIPAAFYCGGIQRRLGAIGISPRGMLALQMVLMAAACSLPWVVQRFVPDGRQEGGGEWAIWVAIAFYSPLSGTLWPVVESFLAGGRTEAQLRASIGKFNVCWSSSIVVTLLAISPLIERHALATLPVLAVVHILCIGVLLAFRTQPGAHAHHEHVASENSKALLEFLRYMLPTAFMFIATLSPYLPSALTRLGVEPDYKTALAATWLAARVLTFLALERWHGWHGRWSTPIGGGFILLGAFAAVVIGPLFFTGTAGLAALLIGLAGFGVGIGIIYACALYYAMEVGASGVDAGGTHEALIGVGYASGPLCGLIAISAARRTPVGADGSDLLMLALVSGVALLVGGAALAKARHHLKQRARTMTEPPPSRI